MGQFDAEWIQKYITYNTRESEQMMRFYKEMLSAVPIVTVDTELEPSDVFGWENRG